MKKKLFLLFFLLLIGSGMCIHADTYDGIYAWVDGSSTCYKLESMPQVTYGSGSATLTVAGKNVLTLPLTNGSDLTITYGTYESIEISYTISKAAYGTLILPFDAAIPEGMQVYKIYEKEAGTGRLVLSEVSTTLEACTPYVVYSEGYGHAEADDGPVLAPSKIGTVKNRTYTFSGMPINEKTEYTDGLLVGELASKKAPNYADGADCLAYVLQMQNNKVGFYRVQSDNITVGANRCYLCLSKEQAAGARALFFDTAEDATGVATVTTNYTEKVQKNGKFIRGGRVIIIKDGRQYNANGTLVSDK